MSRGLKIIAIYAAIAVAVYLLQVLPVTGLILTLFHVLLWIGILLHVMMLHLAIAAAMRRIARIWLVVPAVFYAACIAALVTSGVVPFPLAGCHLTANEASWDCGVTVARHFPPTERDAERPRNQ